MKKIISLFLIINTFFFFSQEKIKNTKNIKVSFILDSIYNQEETTKILENNNAINLVKKLEGTSIFTYNDKFEVNKGDIIIEGKTIFFERDNVLNLCKSCSKVQRLINKKSDDKGEIKNVLYKLDSKTDQGCGISDYKNLDLNEDLNLFIIKESQKITKNERIHYIFWYEHDNSISLNFKENTLYKTKLNPVQITAESNKLSDELYYEWTPNIVYNKKSLITYTNSLKDTSICLQVQDKATKCKSDKKCITIKQKENCDCLKEFKIDFSEKELYKIDLDNDNTITIKSKGKNFFLIMDYVCGVEGASLELYDTKTKELIHELQIDIVDNNNINTDNSIKNESGIFSKYKQKLIFKIPYSDLGEQGLNIVQKNIEIKLIPISNSKPLCSSNSKPIKILFAKCE